LRRFAPARAAATAAVAGVLMPVSGCSAVAFTVALWSWPTMLRKFQPIQAYQFNMTMKRRNGYGVFCEVFCGSAGWNGLRRELQDRK
jgi:hypothetical protein